MSMQDVSRLSRRDLRKLLDLALANDADFTAFCMDYFPEIHKRITSGMERQQKLNLLLELAAPAALEQRLTEATHPSLRRSKRAPESALTVSRAGPWILALLGILPCFLFLVYNSHSGFLRNHKAVNNNLIKGPEPLQDSPLLVTQPAQAEVFYSDTGQRVGRTPIPILSIRRPAMVVIKKTGFRDFQIFISAQTSESISVSLSPDLDLAAHSTGNSNPTSLIY